MRQCAREGMKKQINYKKISETHHQCYKAQKEQFQHTVDKTEVFLLLSTFTSQDYKDRIHWRRGKDTHLQRRDPFSIPVYTQAYTATQTNWHTKGKSSRKSCISFTAKCKDERAKKQGSTQGHCPQSQVINTKKVQEKLCYSHMHVVYTTDH